MVCVASFLECNNRFSATQKACNNTESIKDQTEEVKMFRTKLSVKYEDNAVFWRSCRLFQFL